MYALNYDLSTYHKQVNSNNPYNVCIHGRHMPTYTTRQFFSVKGEQTHVKRFEMSNPRFHPFYNNLSHNYC